MIDWKKWEKLKDNKHVESFKYGLRDIQTVAQEGNFGLFLKQFVAILVIFLLFKYVAGKCSSKVQYYNDQMAAVQIQQNSAQEYQTNKMQLIDLEPRFPDADAKNEWLLRQILIIFKDAGVTPEVASSQEEEDAGSYITVSLPVTTFMEFNKFADLLASIENRDEYVKISTFSLEKETTPARLGSNKITMKFNTVFPKDKIAKKIFKDYDKLVAAREAQEGGK